MGGQEDDDHLHLQWNHHSSTLIQMFYDQLASESLVDVTLSCDGQFLRAHKLVLSSCSPYFQKMFDDFPDKHPIVILKGVTFTDLRTIVEYAYTGQAKVQMENLAKLLSAAETLQIKGLIEIKGHQDAASKIPTGEVLVRPKKRIKERTVKRPTAKARRTQMQLSKIPAEPGSTPSSVIREEHDNQHDTNRNVPITAGLKVKVEPSELTTEKKEVKPEAKHDSASSSEDEEPRLMIDMAEAEEEPHRDDFAPLTVKSPKRPKKDRRISPATDGCDASLQYNALQPFGMHLDHALDCSDEPEPETVHHRLRRGASAAPSIEKIPRPRNAFMVFGNLWRPKLREQNPGETNTQISIKLGNMWHDMPETEKKVYYEMSRAEAEAHKEKYPDYVYSPKEARENKRNRAKNRRSKEPLVLGKEPQIPKLLLKLPISSSRTLEHDMEMHASGLDALSLVNVVMPDDARSDEA